MNIRPLAHLEFEYESLLAVCKHSVKFESQNARLKNKHPVLLNVCHYNFVHSFVAQSFVRYINDQVSHY